MKVQEIARSLTPSIVCMPGPSTQAIVPSARMQRQRSSPGCAGFGNASSSQGANQVSSHSPSPPIGGFEAITTRQRWSGSVLRSQAITWRTLLSGSCAPSSKPMKSCERPCHLNSDPGRSSAPNSIRQPGACSTISVPL
jgi:hypothetical protein